jgi:mannose-6-phosphate isomerase-like protein (cupin superfamily)
MNNLPQNTQSPKADIEIKTFRHWEVYEVLPLGWKIDNTCGSPLNGYDFCNNGKSVLNGGKRALVRSIKKGTPRIKIIEKTKEDEKVNKNEIEQNYIFPAKTVNTLARKKFQAQLLKEITFDLMVCEIEGWSKKDYIRELKNLINSIDV